MSVTWSCRKQFKEMQACMKPLFVLLFPLYSPSAALLTSLDLSPTIFLSLQNE